MLDAELLRFARRVQRIGEQQQARNQIWFGGAEHRGLASTVGVAAEKDPARDTLTQSSNRVAQARTIALRVAGKRRTGSPVLAEGQIATQDGVAMSSKRFAERHQQRGAAIRTRAVSQDQRFAVGIRGRVQEAADSGVQRIVGKRNRLA